MTNSDSKYYSKEEFDRIITKALHLKAKEDISHQDLIDIGKEMNLDQRTIEIAIEKVQKQAKDEQAYRRLSQNRKSKLKQHLMSFVTVNIFLFLINVFSGGDWWFHWPLLGWGIGLVFHFKKTYAFDFQES